ncbi:MAG TPA: hypothetical protein VJQ55_05935, partial [Candidatus Binatia bacterium]|nr:hypothetical protein [Candidatus Binatia bacterium]
MDHENWLGLADIYALGALDGNDLNEFEAHLAAGCARCHTRIHETAAILSAIPTSIEAAAPAPALKASLLERIDSEQPGLIFIHAD